MPSKKTLFKDLLIPTMIRTNKYLNILTEKRLSASSVDLTLKQFILLHKVSEEGRTQSELAIITDRDKGSLTRLIQSLERKDFVVRSESEADRRINIVESTPAGIKAMKKAKRIVLKVFDELTADISEREQNAMKRTADTLMSRAIELLDRPNKKQ